MATYNKGKRGPSLLKVIDLIDAQTECEAGGVSHPPASDSVAWHGMPNPQAENESMAGGMADDYQISDAIDFLRAMRGQGVKGVATSPPYNKAFKGRGKKGHSNWKNSALMSDNYTHHDDNMPEAEYVKWQRTMLLAALDCVGDEGVVLYNIGRRIKNLHEDRRQSIIDGLPLRQTVIWNRGSTFNQGGKRPSMLPPIYELIYIIAGSKWRLPLRFLQEFRYWGDVWRIPPETRTLHPATFPLELAVRMAKLIDGFLVDPFAGSGTMGIAAMKIGVPYMLNDLSPDYKQMFIDRRSAYLAQKNRVLPLDDEETTHEVAYHSKP